MTKRGPARPERQQRKKRGKREDKGDRIVVRMTAKERQMLADEAGELSISAFVRAKLFGGGVRLRDELRAIEALHVAGRHVQELAAGGNVDERMVAITLGDLCGAIRDLADAIDRSDLCRDAPAS